MATHYGQTVLGLQTFTNALYNASIANPPFPHQTRVVLLTPPRNTWVANCGQTAADSDMGTIDSLGTIIIIIIIILFAKRQR